MKVTAIVFDSSSQQDLDIIRKIASNILKAELRIIDLRSYNLELDLEHQYIIFGKKALEEFLKDKRTRTIDYLVLPEIQKLRNTEENKNSRLETAKRLNEFKEILDIKFSISLDDLPSVSTDTLKKIEIALENRKLEKWECTLHDGRKISISLKPIPNELNITFSELFTMRMAMESLGIEKINGILNKKK